VKNEYRQSILQKRDALDSSEALNLSKIILSNADLELSLSTIKTLGSYFSANNEVDLKTLTNIRLKKNLLTTFPKIRPNHSMSLLQPKNY
jgi:5-formyltetrahydrofolate cyclo-ligase